MVRPRSRPPAARPAACAPALAQRRPDGTPGGPCLCFFASQDGLRADLVAAKRQVALAEKEAEMAQQQLQQREAEIAHTHRSLLKLDDMKAVSAAQSIQMDTMRSQLKAAQESTEALRADCARLKKALAAREAAARSAHAPAAADAAAHAGDADAMTLAQARDVLGKLGELTCVAASAARFACCSSH